MTDHYGDPRGLAVSNALTWLHDNGMTEASREQVDSLWRPWLMIRSPDAAWQTLVHRWTEAHRI